MWENRFVTLRKEIYCDKREFREYTSVSPAACVPEIGIFLFKKYHVAHQVCERLRIAM
jgi:hypothetical protein